MAKNDQKEPWNSKIQETQEFRAFYEEQEQEQEEVMRRPKKTRTGPQMPNKKPGSGSTVFLTFLVAIMFAIIGAAIIFTIWNSSSPNMETVASNFYSSGRSSAVTSSSSSSSKSGTEESSEEETSSSSKVEGNTYEVIGGDYPNLIAEKTGVAWEEIVKLNPTLDANNPGFYKDGSQLTAGQTLIISK